MFRVVDFEALRLVARPCLSAEVFVTGVVAHFVTRVFDPGPESPALRETLVECERQRRHVVAAARAVAVERIDGRSGRGRDDTAAVIVAERRVAVCVVAQHLEGRTQRVDLPDVVERPLVAVCGVPARIAARGVRHASGRHVRRGSGRRLRVEVQVREFGSEAVSSVELVNGPQCRAAVVVVVVHRRCGAQPFPPCGVGGLLLAVHSR